MADGAPRSGRSITGHEGLDPEEPVKSGAVGEPRFLGLAPADRQKLESSDVVLFGVPSAVGTDGRPGAEGGPAHARGQSWTFGGYNPALGLDIFEDLQIADGGDLDPAERDPEATLRMVQARTFGLSRGGQIPGLVGGTGYLTLGALRGIVQAKRRPVSFLHLSAAHGLRQNCPSERGMLALAQREGLLKRGGVLQIGVRGPASDAEEIQDALRFGFERLSVDNVRWDIHASMAAIRNITDGHTVYVSVDLAALDPSVCPGVTRPCLGGLTSWEVQQILRSLVGADIVGFDVVGVCPAYDTSDLTGLMAVGVMHEVLSVVAESRDSSRASLVGGRSGRTSA